MCCEKKPGFLSKTCVFNQVVVCWQEGTVPVTLEVLLFFLIKIFLFVKLMSRHKSGPPNMFWVQAVCVMENTGNFLRTTIHDFWATKDGTPNVTDEYANRIPNPKHTPKYTKAEVLRTQDKHPSAEQLRRALLLLLLPYKKPCCC